MESVVMKYKKLRTIKNVLFEGKRGPGSEIELNPVFKEISI